MNELEYVKEKLIKKFPKISLEYDPAETEKGSSWLDIKTNKQLITIEWKPQEGFGLYLDRNEGYGLGPTEIYRNKAVLFTRIVKSCSR